MPIFHLGARVTVSTSTSVEADTLEEAIDLAKKRPVLHVSAGGPSESDVWVVDELDGEPDSIYHDN